MDILQRAFHNADRVVQNGTEVTRLLVHVQVHVHVTQSILAVLHLGRQRTALVPLGELRLPSTE